jgi:pantothenate kinase
MELEVLKRDVFGSIEATKHQRWGRRYLLGIAGPPAAGKTTLAERLVHSFNAQCGENYAQLVSMDGLPTVPPIIDIYLSIPSN